eukprot:scaffold438_cov250-Pinguiococcus_pyrenoidosus.AAC.46
MTARGCLIPFMTGLTTENRPGERSRNLVPHHRTSKHPRVEAAFAAKSEAKGRPTTVSIVYCPGDCFHRIEIAHRVTEGGGRMNTHRTASTPASTAYE